MKLLELTIGEVELLKETLEVLLEGIEEGLQCYSEQEICLQLKKEYSDVQSLLVRLS